MRIKLAPAFVLHTYPFSETSTIVDAFTATHGRISLLAKGARARRSCFRGLLRPFTSLSLSWSGKSELMTLTDAEYRAAPIMLTGTGLLSGMYLNELMIRLLPKLDDHPKLFEAYENTLPLLIHSSDREKALRLFEKILLNEIGYGLSFDKEANTSQTPIMNEHNYQLILGHGFIKNTHTDASSATFKGAHLLSLSNNWLETKEILQTSKQLMRLLIAHLLDNKPLKTRCFVSEVIAKF
ncbi:MAG: repair protein RecO [Gammaproteobacteria bacterium]|jgi:DNA repair protein RecO (recombination protein O)|nr:repair protein RecO [Gammaproteobacteria bacterium]